MTSIVPDGETKHSLEPGNGVSAEALVERHDRFDVAMRAKRVAPRRCFAAQIIGVVDLPVAYHPDIAIRTLERLIASGEIHDSKPSGADACAFVPDDTFAIRSAVLEGRGHASNRFRMAQLGAPPGARYRAEDAAHGP